MQPSDIPKQRGIYSEILTTEDTENLKVFIHLIISFLVGFDYWAFC